MMRHGAAVCSIRLNVGKKPVADVHKNQWGINGDFVNEARIRDWYL